MRRFFLGLTVIALAAPLPLLAETTDRQIAQQIIKELKHQKESGDLKGFNLDLQVEDGAVYLKGFVSEREQRRRAVDAARKVDGVTQVYDEIEIKKGEAVAAEKRQTEDEVEQPQVRFAARKLKTPPEPPAVDVEMLEEKDAADIGGFFESVETKAKKPSIPTNVYRAPRMIQVSEQETVPTGEFATRHTSREITDAIVEQYRTAMSRGDLQGFGIDVQVDQGVVRLEGTVSTSDQREYAAEVAGNVDGVNKVVNALEVERNQTTQLVSHDGSDEGVQHAFRQQSNRTANDSEAERIAKEVVAGLQTQKQEGLLSSFGIDVQVDGRIVWMSGYVKNAEQHARALNVARYVSGVEKVVNDLKIQDQTSQLRPVNATLPQAAAGQQMMNYQMVPVQYLPPQAMQASNQTPMAFGPARAVNHTTMQPGQPVPMTGNAGVGIAPARFDHPQMPGYAWPSYAAAPNYGAVTYPKQYSASAWPYIGPFYPYPQVPLGWRRVTLEWDDGWWNLKFKNTHMH